jgi:hypothetical protein
MRIADVSLWLRTVSASSGRCQPVAYHVVPLFVAHGEVIASIDPAPPSADRVVCGGRTEAGDPLFGRQVEEEAKDAFFGRILQSDRTANRRLGLIRRSNGRIELLASLYSKHNWISPDRACELLPDDLH